MPAPLVSVVMPCYRQAHFLPAALESLFAQSHPAVQPVVVNDGSDDDTDAVAARYGDRICYVKKANGGPNSARNTGIQQAEGKYLLFFDADDLLHPDALAALVEAAEGRDDRLCVMGHRFFAEDPTAEKTREHFPPSPLSLLPHLLHGNIAPIHSFLAPHSLVVAAGGLEEGLRQCEDWDLWLRLALRGAAGVAVPLAGAYYRRYPGSNGGDPSRMLRAQCQVLVRAYRALTEAPQLMAQWGRELFLAAQTARRAMIAARLGRSDYAPLTNFMRELGALGCGARKGWPRAALEAVLGDRVDRLAVAYSRWFDPAAFAYYNRLGKIGNG
jgi:glycosyltransferase involved in cell wall biosynthesis